MKQLRKRLVVGAALALVLTLLMIMLAYLSGAYRQVMDAYAVQTAMLQEREQQVQEKEAELAALKAEHDALVTKVENRRAAAEAGLAKADEMEREKEALMQQTEQILAEIEAKRQELAAAGGDESYYLEVYNALTEGLEKVKESLAGN